MKKHIGDKAYGRQCPLSAIRPIAVACATLMMTSGAHAQATTETVVVTGIRGSIESSIAVKRNSDSIVEAVTAEDLGKLPDVSIAESLARLPGLAAQRVNGTAQSISIRGLAPKFGVTLLNGREVVSGGPDRSAEFDQFPAELLSGATVYKTPDATLSAQGLSGTVNMLTVRPLDFGSRKVNLNARIESNSNGVQIPGLSSKGNRLSASYVDQFADRTLGVALGAAHLDTPEQQQHYANWWWANTANTKVWDPTKDTWCPGSGWVGDGSPLNGVGGDCGIKGVARDAVALQGFEATAFSTNQVRDGLMAVVEYKPNKDLHTVLDLYYSKFTKKYIGREFQGEMNTWNGVTYTGTQYANYGGEKVVVGGAIDNISGKLLSRRNKRDDTIAAVGLNNELKLGDWKATVDLSYSRADRDENTAEAYAGLKSGTPSGFSSTNISLNGVSQFVPTANWADPAVVQLQQFWGQMASNRVFKVGDELKGLRLSAKKDVDWGAVNQIETGLNYSERSKDYSQIKWAYDLVAGGDHAPIPANLLMSPATLGFGSIPAVVSFDANAVIDSGLLKARQDDLSSAPDRQWGVKEKITTAFAKASLEFTAGVPFRGNVGLQVVQADQHGTGLIWVNNGTVPTSGGKSYTDVLPSLNLAADLGSNTTLRLGAAKVLARPSMEDMRAGVGGLSRSISGSAPWSGSGGNPTLDPWRANAFDVSVEKYLDKRSYVAVAGFIKNLQSTVYKQDDFSFSFAGFPDPLNGVPPVGSTAGKMTHPMNGQGGYIAGFEVSGALDLGRYVSALDGFGVIASGTSTDSNMHQDHNLSNPLEGLSGSTYSLVAYYEKSGYQARVAQRYRSRYMAAIRTAQGDTNYTTIEPEHIMDLQLGYSFDSGMFKGLSLVFEINNVTNEPYRTMMTVDSNSGTVPGLLYPGVFDRYGRQYLFGVNYKF